MNEIRMQARVIGPSAQGHLKVAIQGAGHDTRDMDVPIERIPSQLRIPNCGFVAVVQLGEFKRVESAGEHWLEVQRQIRAVLNRDWDPIGVADSVVDEYDGYIAGLYAMLKQGASNESIARHLLVLESQMGMTANRNELLRNIADRLRALRLPLIPDAR